MLSHDQIEGYDRDGFVVAPGLFTPAEAALLREHAHARADKGLSTAPDDEGRTTTYTLWMEMGDDIFTRVATHPRILESMRALMREDCYHWHSKIMLKRAKDGGAWQWHQDYGYWYGDGCPYPRLASCLVALDRADRANGCLKVMVGSHHLGRLEHSGSATKQWGADPARLEAITSLHPVRYLEADPGTAIFFHCNTLHASEPNASERPRTSVICCYNGMSNIPVAGRGHGPPVKMTACADDGILRFGPPLLADAS